MGEVRTPDRESNSTGWFVGIILALALLAIAYLVYSANVSTKPVPSTPASSSAPAASSAV